MGASCEWLWPMHPPYATWRRRPGTSPCDAAEACPLKKDADPWAREPADPRARKGYSLPLSSKLAIRVLAALQ